MHELSIAKGMMANLRPWLDGQPDGLRVRKIRVKAGPFRAIMPDALVSAWEIVRMEHPKTAESSVEIDPSYISVICKGCGATWDAERPVFTCPKCGSSDLEFGGGNELFIEDIETYMEENDGKKRRQQ